MRYLRCFSRLTPMIKASDILLLATKGTVVAFHRQTGQRLWTTPLKSSWGGDFVSLVADERRVFAHTKGEVFGLDLFTGQVLWNDGLAGFGFNLAALALPGSAQAQTSVTAEYLAQQQRANSGSGSTHAQ